MTIVILKRNADRNFDCLNLLVKIGKSFGGRYL